ncbi:hypothetical protein [Sinosporangium album]|nr:hypothetical protein [Sinosporangium album]
MEEDRGIPSKGDRKTEGDRPTSPFPAVRDAAPPAPAPGPPRGQAADDPGEVIVSSSSQADDHARRPAPGGEARDPGLDPVLDRDDVWDPERDFESPLDAEVTLIDGFAPAGTGGPRPDEPRSGGGSGEGSGEGFGEGADWRRADEVPPEHESTLVGALPPYVGTGPHGVPSPPPAGGGGSGELTSWPAREVIRAAPDEGAPGSAPQQAWRVPSPPRSRAKALLLSLGDVPVRVVYGIGATIVTAITVVLIFALFSGDEPHKPVQNVDPPATTPAPTPSRAAQPALPPVPSLRESVAGWAERHISAGAVRETPGRDAEPGR